MVIHVVEIQTDEHGQCGILSSRTDSSNLATFVFSAMSGRSWTDQHNPAVLFTRPTWAALTLSHNKNPKLCTVTRPWHRVIRLPRVELTDAERRSSCSTATIKSTSS